VLGRNLIASVFKSSVLTTIKLSVAKIEAIIILSNGTNYVVRACAHGHCLLHVIFTYLARDREIASPCVANVTVLETTITTISSSLLVICDQGEIRCTYKLMKNYESNYAKDTGHKIITDDRYWRSLSGNIVSEKKTTDRRENKSRTDFMS